MEKMESVSPILAQIIFLCEEFPCYAKWEDLILMRVRLPKSKKIVPLQYLFIGDATDLEVYQPHLKL